MITRHFINNATWVLLLAISPGFLFADVPTTMAIRNARVVTVSGPALTKGTVLIRGGLIEAVGENIAIPADAWVIEGEGLTVYPGLMDGLSTWGITDESAIGTAGAPTGRGAARTAITTPITAAPAANTAAPVQGPADRPATTSWLRAADLVKTSDRRLDAARSAGFTSAVTFPTKGIFAGQGAVINLAGHRQGDMIVSAPAGQYVAMTPAGFTTYPGSLMGVIAYIRQVYLDAAHYRQARDMYAKNPKGMRRPEYDRALEGVLDSPLVLLPATRSLEVPRMLNFASELKLKPVLYGAHAVARQADLIGKSGVPVLVSLKWPERLRTADPEYVDELKVLQLREDAPSVPKALAAANVKFAFYSDGIDRPADILKAVKRAIDAGLSSGQALRAMTLSPAEIFGVADRMGSIEKGKIANLTITKGDLFQEGTKVEYVIIDGVKFAPVPELPAAADSAAGTTEEK